MDLGGTNLRVMIMEMEPGEPMRSKQFNTRMPNAAQHGTAEKVGSWMREMNNTPLWFTVFKSVLV